MAAQSKYEIKHSKDSTIFEVIPAPIPADIGQITTIIILGILGSLVGLNSSARLLLICLPIALGIIFMMSNRDKKARMTMSFIVSSKEIVVGKKAIPTASIHKLYLRNSVSAEEQIVDIAYLAMTNAMVAKRDIGISSVGAMHLARTATKAKQNRQLAAVSWRLDAEASGVVTTLAYGMEAPVARGLTADVEKKLASLA